MITAGGNKYIISNPGPRDDTETLSGLLDFVHCLKFLSYPVSEVAHLDEFVAIAQTILAAALVTTTAAYVWYSKSMARAMRDELDFATQPVIAPAVNFFGPVIISIRFENLGNGVAYDLRVNARSEPGGLSFSWAYPSLLPKQSATVLLPHENEQIGNLLKFERIRFAITCVDLRGKTHSLTPHLELGQYRETLDKTSTLSEESAGYYQKKQTEYLKEISVSLSRLSRN